ncbi:MAG: hypothetical protein COW04_05515 [Deltaproteobacteria bacterium CG12_big_fil_rev_8_21_14_0_65_43_10]|nr:MAG: hypothetical protein AUK23_03675 [Deltaproteobacteria bacterium CG2_30_43_15]PIQ45820.1 MAG: hypothetical protein COW04_05515 [Deltaproteobacteria bacterium CG12_big_fil_rev_8_21_14_0_65_43_10]PIU85879.1 MAG: hypothetical protein COS67_05470 [Deltaproteobacteria bacterium CG06_land_8_20_14_3_00_44_19]PIZ19341.1 MAG: hypothetical protein COY50_10470 [Deltaproteobacteria bacterium CG_4_10_14_0_8_um_filter_43_12]PJB40317.1 MAG: hypothetical protein CO106_08785 [Deltaproteobacteria bacteriu
MSTRQTVGLEQATLKFCINEARQERVIVTRQGKPVALVIGIDEEQLELGSDDSFWKLIEERRTQDTISREQLEKSINSD